MQWRFENQILDSDRRELWRGSELVSLEPQVFDLLLYLIQNRDRVVSKDDLIASVWSGRIVSDSALDSRINATRRAVGDNGQEQRLIRTVPRKGFRFIGTVDETTKPNETSTSFELPKLRDVQQEIHFCTASDGVRIAYALAGSGPPLVKAANWLNHLEYDWESPIWSHLLHALAAEHRLIRYDERGNGLSDWNVDEISFDSFVRDLETVIDAIGLKRFSLLGISQGCPVSIAYAARNPGRVSHLVLYGGYARGRCRRGNPAEIEQADAVQTLMRHGWGQENPAFRQIFTTRFMPNGTPEQMRWFNDLQRMTASPDNAARIRRATDNIDITELLRQIRIPTLVMHCRNDAAIPHEEGRVLAAGIPGARFVTLEGRNHLILESDPSWPRFLDEIRDFLKT